MNELRPTEIHKKVANPFIMNCIVTIVVGFVSKSPLAEHPWLFWVQDSSVCLALLTVIAFTVGYRSENEAR